MCVYRRLRARTTAKAEIISGYQQVRKPANALIPTFRQSPVLILLKSREKGTMGSTMSRAVRALLALCGLAAKRCGNSGKRHKHNHKAAS
eukprot:39362-Pleurochrysis_carterae.AAC.1